jgi:hypothetical protein
MSMSASPTDITDFLQSKLAMLALEDVPAVVAARWLDDAGLLRDSGSRPGKPLRDLLRAAKIGYAEQRPSTPNGRWFIVSRGGSRVAPTPSGRRIAAAKPRWASPAETAADARQRSCSTEDVELALAALDSEAIQIPARDWPGGIRDLDQPGLYSWWVDAPGAEDLSKGLGQTIIAGRIYAGQTGATKWPSGTIGSRTLAGRIGGNHLNGRIRGSTFRLTLAACLVEPLVLARTGARQLDSRSEESLSAWMRVHLAIAVMPYADRDKLGDLEHNVLTQLDPPLNLDRMERTPARSSLSRKRAELS